MVAHELPVPECATEPATETTRADRGCPHLARRGTPQASAQLREARRHPRGDPTPGQPFGTTPEIALAASEGLPG